MHKLLIISLLIVSIGGCARLRVTKITPSQKATGADCNIKGMRYYLSRPYVCIKKPILVTSTSEYYLARADGTGTDRVLCDTGDAKIKQSLALFDINNVGAAAQDISSSYADAIGGGGTTAATAPATAATAAAKADAPQAETPNVVGSPSADIGAINKPLKAPAPPEKSGEADAPTDDSAENIEIVYLPDLDEQYAVHGKNCFSKHAYGLRFEGGWKLAGVNAEADSTPAPVEFLNLVNKAIQAARNIELARIDPAANKTPTSLGALQNISEVAVAAGDENKNQVLYETVTETYIKPGVYRINKPWEMDQQAQAGSGLLAQLGLPTVVRKYDRVAKAGTDLATTLGDVNQPAH